MSRAARGTALILASVLSLATVAASSAVAQDASQREEALKVRETARELVRQFYVADFESVHGKFTDEYKKSLTLEGLKDMRWTVEDRLGKELEVVDEFVEARGEYVMYTRRAKFEKAPTPIDARWLLRDGKVAGLDFRPAN